MTKYNENYANFVDLQDLLEDYSVKRWTIKDIKNV